MLRIRNSKWGLYLFDIWVIAFSLFAIYTFLKASGAASDAKIVAKSNKNLITQNHNRINEIQAARVASCKRTYEGIREVFKPFAVNQKDPKVITFNNRIDELKKACPKQTRVKKERG